MRGPGDRYKEGLIGLNLGKNSLSATKMAVMDGVKGRVNLKVVFLSVGSIKKVYIKDGLADYIKRIKRYTKVEIIEVKEGLGTKRAPIKDVKRKEGSRLLEKLKEGDRIIVLSEEGTPLSSVEFSCTIEKILSSAVKRVVFITGGSFGIADAVKERAAQNLSLSLMTMPHELARLVIAEQVYRAFTILRGEPYSH